MADAIFNVEELERNASRLLREFQAAEPFPHLVLDGLLGLSPAAVSTFPDIAWPGWFAMVDRYQQNKRACADLGLIPEPFKALIRELSEPRFLKALEGITGIKPLLPDPYLAGGGLHLSGAGGILSPHTDFHYHRTLNLYRRINVLVYLNENWSQEDGGCLYLYDAQDRPVKTVVPDWGRVVIFRTDHGSVHGFPVPVAEGKWRRSVALYYYTAAPTKDFSGDETTYWREHGEQGGVVRRARFLVYRGLTNLSLVISNIAVIANPNQGVPLLKAALAVRRKEKIARTEARGCPKFRGTSVAVR
ncbi:2OG-Fe(II) oxygenase [Mycolicibacterium gadium]|uniref:2OG-Fe(II) oxygenase n=1 Tax=Mycolicibacterium gadium TaxID=1794 RepID=UPI002FDDA447